jgi:hypothetical protein
MERLLLLDADVIINLNSLNLWNGVVKNNEVYVGSTVARIEVTHYPDSQRQRIPLNLIPQIDNGTIKEISASTQDLKELTDKLRPSKIGLDPGELESIAVIAENKLEGLKICVIDKSAIMALSYLELDGKAISAQEVLINTGMLQRGKEPPHPDFSKKQFDYWVTQGKLILIANSKPETKQVKARKLG